MKMKENFNTTTTCNACCITVVVVVLTDKMLSSLVSSTKINKFGARVPVFFMGISNWTELAKAQCKNVLG